MSIGTGIAVVAETDRGTVRASDMTAEDSAAFRKMGPVMMGGNKVGAILES
jgi:hypothetical protein